MYEEIGTLERARNGEYDFRIAEVLSEAWVRTSGAKLTFLAAMFIFIVIAGTLTVVVSSLFDAQSYYDAELYLKGFLSDRAVSLLTLPVTLPLIVAIVMMGIKRAHDIEITIPSIFDYYVLVWPLVFASIAMNVMIMIGFILLVLPGIYLATAYMFTLPLIVDKNLTLWDAMESSRKAVTAHWFKLFGFNMLMALIITLSALPLGIGLFWTVPLAFIGNGILYRKIFGYGIDANE
ncbi:MAG: hypothetical protein DRG24_10015 [Epsilonproteobacteria bacterium]|nr:MAG: hypothetical protein DRG24_10015 [Campylobacterota bacterium]